MDQAGRGEMKPFRKLIPAAVWLLLIFAAGKGLAEVRLPRLISDGMVLQRESRVNIWGWARPGEKVNLEFRGRHYRTAADGEGRWLLRIRSGAAGGPFTMGIEGENRITLKDIYAGEVWLCSGQSNMALPIARVEERYPDLVAGADNPAIRHFFVPMRYDFNRPQEDLEAGAWQGATAETVRGFSAAAYFFALALYEKYGVPIGLINASVGGTPVEAWMSEKALQAWPVHLDSALRCRDESYVQGILAADQARIGSWFRLLRAQDAGYADPAASWADPDYDDSSWPMMPVPSFWKERGLGPINGAVWFRREIDLPETMAGQPGRLILGAIVDADSVFLNGTFVGTTSYQYPPRRYAVPAGLLKAGKNLLTVRVISNIGSGGFIKDKAYQLVVAGHPRSERREWRCQVGAVMEPLAGQTFIQYKPLGLFNGMIAPLLNYRIKGAIWYQGESNTGRAQEYTRLFPDLIRDWRQQFSQGKFPFLYVQLANFMAARSEPAESGWAALREAQRKTLALPNTGMAVAIDIGEWNDIHPLNKQDVGGRLALWARRLAYKDKKLVPSGPLLRTSRVEGSKIILSFDHTGSGLAVRDGGELRHFAIAGADGRFVWAQARITGDRVEVWSEAISHPAVVRYGWADNPAGANLINREGLPASPFSTEK